MKESYLIPEFRETVHQRFPEKEAELTAAFEKRIAELRAESAGASKEKRQHLENQILPGIAIYEGGADGHGVLRVPEQSSDKGQHP